MEEAYKNRDIDGYLKAKDEAEATKGKEFITAPALLNDDYDYDDDDYDYDDYEDDEDESMNGVFIRRARFLKKAAAIPTPMEAYALWLTVYKAQGGKVRPLGDNPGNYNSRATVIGEGNTIKTPGGPATAADPIAYDDISWRQWTPTKETESIPPGYGSASMELLLLPDVVPQNLHSTSGDSRAGWEYGHTTVYILRRDPSVPGGLVAETNEQYAVPTYKDVEQYCRRKSISELVAAIGGVSPQPAGRRPGALNAN